MSLHDRGAKSCTSSMQPNAACNHNVTQFPATHFLFPSFTRVASLSSALPLVRVHFRASHSSRSIINIILCRMMRVGDGNVGMDWCRDGLEPHTGDDSFREVSIDAKSMLDYCCCYAERVFRLIGHVTGRTGLASFDANLG